MKTLKNFSQLFRINKAVEINVDDLINGNIRTAAGWQVYELDDDLKDRLINAVLDELGGWSSTKNRLKSVLKYGPVSHWGLKRMQVKPDQKNGFRVNYVTGQYRPAELQQIRNDLKK